ncbi:MAG: HAD-IB family hydrolase [Gemmatimonadota bacterium]|nr:HAD-IB family hydrolase [Gemmatimonadota bacterium]
MTRPRAAVFDLDGTLLPRTSAERLFLRFLVRKRLVGPRGLLAAAARVATLPLRGREEALLRNKAYMAGISEQDVRALADDFVAAIVAPRLCPVILRRMEGLRADGFVLDLLSGTHDVIAEAVGRRLGMADALGTALEVVDGRYTGTIAGVHYFGPAKVEGVEILRRRRDFDPEVSFAFGDHGADVAFLERFGHPVAVEPDRSLRREALRRGWEVVER